MSQKKYLRLFEGLARSKGEMRKFIGHIKRSNVKDKESMILLFDQLKYLKRQEIDFLEEDIDKRIFWKVYPHYKNEAVNQKFRQLTSNFSLLLMEFLTLLELEEAPHVKKQLLAAAMKKRGVDLLFSRYNSDLLEDVKEIEDVRDFLVREKAFEELYFHPNAKLHSNKEIRLNLVNSLDCLEHYYTVQKLKKYCELIVLNLIYGELYSAFSSEDVKLILEKPKEENTPVLVKIFKVAARFLLDPDYEKYQRLDEAFNQHKDKIFSERWTIIRFLIVGVNSLGMEPKEKMQEAFKHYVYAIKNGLIIGGNFISLDSFNNVIYLACYLKKTDYAREFIASHLKYLNMGNDLPESVRLLFESYVLFEEDKKSEEEDKDKKYKLVVENLSQIQYHDFSYGIRKHVLMLKCIFESDELLYKKRVKLNQDSEYRIKAYSNTVKTYLKRQFQDRFISKEVREKNMNFIKILRLMDEFDYGDSVDEICLELEDMKDMVVESSWLKQKIKQLK